MLCGEGSEAAVADSHSAFVHSAGADRQGCREPRASCIGRGELNRPRLGWRRETHPEVVVEEPSKGSLEGPSVSPTGVTMPPDAWPLGRVSSTPGAAVAMTGRPAAGHRFQSNGDRKALMARWQGGEFGRLQLATHLAADSDAVRDLPQAGDWVGGLDLDGLSIALSGADQMEPQIAPWPCGAAR